MTIAVDLGCKATKQTMLTPRTNFGIQTNSVDPDKTAPVGAVLSGSTLFATEPF